MDVSGERRILTIRLCTTMMACAQSMAQENVFLLSSGGLQMNDAHNCIFNGKGQVIILLRQQ